MNVPFVDLKTQYHSLKPQIDEAIQTVCANSTYILGPEVAAFEKSFAAFTGASFCVGVANGTESMTLAYQALGIGTGDEVIIPAHTFVATALAVIRAGAKPVLVDIDPGTYLIDTSQIEEKITSATKAICPVHLYGRACAMEDILSLANKYSLHVIEDAAQSHGSRWKGKTTGTFGIAGSFSFFPSKNLGAYGDGGAVITSNENLATKLKTLRSSGSLLKYEYLEQGANCRLDSLQAAVLSVKLNYLPQWNHKRWEAAKKYCDLLSPLAKKGIVTLPELATAESNVFHLFVIQVDQRKKIMEQLAKNDIQTGIHYPFPFYLQPPYRNLGYNEGSFPVTEKISTRILSLPMFPEITDRQIEYVVEKLDTAYCAVDEIHR